MMKSPERFGVTQFSRERGVECEFVWPTLDKSFFANLLDRTLLHQEAPFSSTSVIFKMKCFILLQNLDLKFF